jgi:uncharacterized protein (TIGR00159 family)
VRALLAHFLPRLTLWEAASAAIDILVVYYVVYRALLLVKGTRAAQMLTGLVLVAGGFFAAKFLELTTLSWLLDNLLNYAIIFLIVIFQHDIRRGLMRVGSNLFSSGRQYEETFVFEEVIQAAEQLARSRLGALVVFERDAELEDFFRGTGELIDARVSKEVLVALFLPSPENTVHDGAVVIKNLRLHRAGCVLPLSANPKLDKSLGTRHRAAIGITEETDAVVVVVSEERGTVSLCFGGNIARDLEPPMLRKALLGLFHKRDKNEVKRAARETAPKIALRPTPVVPDPTHPSSSVTVRLSVAESPPPQPAAPTVPEPPRAPDADDFGAVAAEVGERGGTIPMLIPPAKGDKR